LLDKPRQMAVSEQRHDRRPDRRRFPRGGRRASDRPGRHPTVLIADSYEAARVPYARYLHRYGFQVEEAADGERALAAINQSPPHVILVEHDLPALSAVRLRQWLAQNWRTRHIPLIVLTANADPHKAALKPPAAGVLVKPFRLTHMLQEVRRVLRSSQS
jgi:CheY-like chemotaxis protein